MLPSPTGLRTERETKELGWLMPDYSKHRSAASHDAYACFGAVAAFPLDERLQYVWS